MKKTQTTKASKHISTYCSFTVHVKGTITANPDKSDCITVEKRQDGFIGQGRMHTDIGSRSESEEFAEPSSAVIWALDDCFDDNTDWHTDINIVLSAIEFGADTSQFIHVLGTRVT